MAKATRAGAALLHSGLPDEIAIWEIFIRLPPKSLLRCRAVCRAWRRATSACDFLLSHHARQPSLPLVYVRNGESLYGRNNIGASQEIVPFNHRAAADQLLSVTRLDQPREFYVLEASCDGLVVLSSGDILGDRNFGICNPATRQYASLWLPSDVRFLGMYRHLPTGEYRLLMYPHRSWAYDPVVHHAESEVDGYVLSLCVLSLASRWPLRNIGPVEVHNIIFDTNSVLFRDRLHWHRMQHEAGSNMIIVFDTTTESFQQMRVPVVHGTTWDGLFEMDGMLGMSSFDDTATSIDIWVLRDYESEVWTLKCHIELPLTEIRASCGKRDDDDSWEMVVVPGDGELLVLVQFPEWLIQVDMDGKLVATFNRKGIHPTQLQLKQSLVPHAFFPSLEGYVVNDWPLI